MEGISQIIQVFVCRSKNFNVGWHTKWRVVGARSRLGNYNLLFFFSCRDGKRESHSMNQLGVIAPENTIFTAFLIPLFHSH
jgi:hypothetical protein